MRGHIRPVRKGSKDDWYVVLFLGRDGAGKAKYRWYRVKGSKKDAQRELSRLLASIDSGAFVEPTKTTLAEFLEYWLENYAKANTGAKTFERYSEIVRGSIIPALGHHTLTKLQPLHIQAFYTEALTKGRKDGRGGLSPTTVKHIHGVLREALGHAVKWQLVARNVADAVEAPKKAWLQVEVLPEDEIRRLLKAAEGTPLHLAVLVLLTTGLRRGELLGLHWSDVDLNRGTMSVRHSVEQTRDGIRLKAPKTARSRRMVLVPPVTVDALRRHKAEQGKHRLQLGEAYRNQDLVFAAPDGGLPNPYALTDSFRRLVQRLGIKAHLHTLRHCHATQMLLLGVHPKIASERLGHSSVDMTLNVYSHALPSMQQEVVDKLDALYRGTLEQSS